MTHALCSRSPRSLALYLAIAGLAIGLSAAAHADQPANPLGGPSVETKVAPGSNGTFGSGAGSAKARGEREIPAREFMRAVETALGADAPEGVRATPELEQKIRAIGSEFAAAQRAYMQQNREALAQMRQLERPAKKDANKPDAPGDESMKGTEPAMSDEDRAALIERLREVRDKAPKAADAHTKVWALLSEPQRAAVQVKLDALHKEMQERDNANYVKRRAAAKAGEGPNASPATATPGNKPKAQKSEAPAEPASAQPAKPAAGSKPESAPARAPIAAEQRERLMRLFERMSPEQREELLRRVEERMNAGTGAANPPAGRARRAAGPGGDAKPAPDMKTIELPAPPAGGNGKPE